MLTYQTLDLIADAYIPFLLMCVLLCGGYRTAASREPLRSGVYQLSQLLLNVSAVYAMGYIDQKLLLWPSWGLDYSTHTALAIALCVRFWRCSPWWQARFICFASLASYAALMRYQQYHTWADMLITALYMAAASTAIHIINLLFENKAPA